MKMKNVELNDKILLKDYLDNDNLNSLFQIVFILYGEPLKKIIAKVLRTTDRNELDGVLTDFYDNLTKPTQKGEKKLRTFDFSMDLLPYLKQSLRSYLNEEFKKEQQKQKIEKSGEENSSIEADMIDDGYSDNSDTIRALLHCLSEKGGISSRDRYILLTYLLGKVANPDLRDTEIYSSISRQLGISEAAAKKAAQRGRDLLRQRIKSNI